MGYVINIRGLYVCKDGELKTTLNEKGRIVYKSGVKVTPNALEATEFETAAEASTYQSIIGIRGKRGQIQDYDKLLKNLGLKRPDPIVEEAPVNEDV